MVGIEQFYGDGYAVFGFAVFLAGFFHGKDSGPFDGVAGVVDGTVGEDLYGMGFGFFFFVVIGLDP